MKKSLKLSVYLILCCLSAAAQDYSKQLHVQDAVAYRQDVAKHPDHRLTEINRNIPGIALDIRYATPNNFMHRPMYSQARAFARVPVVKALQQVQAELKTRGLGLKIFDAYRPYAITVKFYRETPDTNFVADPKKGSKHNRGCAVDLTIVDLKTGKEISMPTGFDSFSRKAAANYPHLPKEVLQHRELLKSVMQLHGFKVNPTEWWHYDFNGWQNYPLLNVPFAQL